MDEKLFYWLSVVVGLASLVLLIADISLVNGNGSLQDKIAMRQTTIQQGEALSQINQALVQLLADSSIKGDSDIKGLLADQGITVKPNAAAKAATDDATAPVTKDSKKK